MRFIPLILLLASVTSGFADTPRMPTPIVTVSSSGRCFFALVPAQGGQHGETTRKPFGVAYELQESGALHELWRTEGWYAFTCFLSNNGRYLVALNDWPFGHEVSKEPALLFYDRGKLLGQFSTADLVKDKSKVRASASYYEWLFRPKVISEDFPGPEAPCYSDPENTFDLTTVDGITYTFDATRGEIKATRSNPLPEEERP
jgi:hypothetical protein